ncbi:MAG: S8 family serine peptidase [Pseudomonadota bacterium]
MTFLRLIFLIFAFALPQMGEASTLQPRLDCLDGLYVGTTICAAIPGIVQTQSNNGGGDGSSVDGSTARPRGGLPRAGRNVVPVADGSPEYVMIVNRTQAIAATTALQAAGATLLRERPLPQLGQRMFFFSFPRNLSLAQGRSVLAGRAPSAVLDLHHIYRRSAGPRVYHAAMLGDDPGGTCRLGRSVRVGVIDGPVNPAHPAFQGVKIARGSFLGRGERQGNAGHGTAVAGLIAGSSRAGALAGLAPGVQIYSAEAFGSGRTGDGGRLEGVAAGLDWLVGNGVRLVNMSFAGESNQVFARVLAAARSRGVVMIAAAGNNRSGASFYPAASPDTIAITAVDANGRLYRQANFGRHIEFAAPGVDLYVAWGSGGSYRSGTSFAAPVVTALLARQASRGGVSLKGARSLLRRSARDLGPGGRDTRYGHGLVQSGGC